MIHAIIYDNRKSGGFTFYERTDGFPGSALSEVQDICNLYREPTTNDPSFRYAPIKGTEWYLLSVVSRVSQVEHQERSHTRSVHFLMDKAGASDFFSTPLCTKALYALAKDCYDKKLGNFSCDWNTYRQFTKKIPAEKSTEALIRPDLMYSSLFRDRFQAFIGLDSDPAGQINHLLHALPHNLKPELSFLIGIENGGESKGTLFNFSSVPDIQKLQGSGYSDAARTVKLTLIAQNGMVSTGDGTGLPGEQELKLAENLLHMTNARYYPMLRHLIQDWQGLRDAIENGLQGAVPKYSRQQIMQAKGKALLEGAITEKECEAFIKAFYPEKKDIGIKLLKNPFAQKPPAPNPGRGNAQPNAKPAPSTPPHAVYEQDPGELKATNIVDSRKDLDTMHPDNQPEPPKSVNNPANAPKAPGTRNPAGAADPKPSESPNKPESAQQTRKFRIPPIVWLFTALAGMIAFACVLFWGGSATASAGVLIITFDSVRRILTNILSYCFGLLTAYALIRLFCNVKIKHK